MSKFYHFISLYILMFFLLPRNSRPLDPHFQACMPRMCGALTIRFPFYIEGPQEPYCGYPGFNVSCYNNQPAIHLSHDSYVIQNISYEDQSLRIVNSAFLDEIFDCFPSIHNFTLDDDSMFSSKYGEIFLFYNCRDPKLPKSPTYKEMICEHEGKRGMVVAVYDHDFMGYGKMPYECQGVVTVPYRGEDGSDIEGVMRKGLVLNWYPLNCSACVDSGGFCGYNGSTSEIKCYCPDRVHSHSCHSGSEGTEKATGQESRKFKLIWLGVGSLGFIIVIFLGVWVCLFVRTRRKIWKKATYFKRNGGLLLQQEMNSNDGVLEKTQIFTIDALERATDSFSQDLILGQGGQGTVFKGMLADGRIVAIKRSKIIEEAQLKEFINEVVILSQINHRNIIKLIGCCLETKVHLLVYEFIPNGTLSHHLHNPEEEFCVTWRMRLQIATEVADALAYLHSSSSRPIYHKDIKSSNILLDEQYRAKLSDFGISRSIVVGQTHLTTRPIGTFGYLDPEFLESQMFTKKSDVYSFGVVLVELLIGQKAIRLVETEDQRSLKIWFLTHTEESCLFDIIDSQIRKGGKQEEFLAIADLAKRCLSWNRVQRPTMKQVVMEIEAIKSFNESVMLEKEIE